jgi:hypothetical protein
MVALRLRTSAPAVLNSARQHSPARPEIRPVFGDIEGKLDVLRVECSKCLRRGRYGVAKQPDRQYGRNSNMMKWKEQLNGDCPKATIVAKLKAARDRKRAETGKCGGNRSLAETRPKLVELAKRLRHARSGRQRSLRAIGAELAARGFVTAKTGKPFVAAQIARMLRS